MDEFCAWYENGNKDKIQTWNMVERQLTPDERNEIAKANPFKYRRVIPEYGAGVAHVRAPTQEDIMDLDYPPVSVEEKKEDERFKDLEELVHKYWDIIPTTDEQREKEIVPELWRLISLLSEQGRLPRDYAVRGQLVEAAFKLNSYRDVEIQRLEQQIQNLQSQFSNTDKFLQRNLPAYIEWKRKHP